MDKIYDPSTATGPVYKNEVHPQLEFFNNQFRRCNQCDLSCGGAVPGAGPLDLSNIKLIVVSDYPGHYEKTYGFPQVPRPYVIQQEELEAKKQNKKVRRRQKYPSQNSGEYIRFVLSDYFNLDPFEEVYYTNAIKCPTERGQQSVNVVGKHINACYLWLKNELAVLEKYVPYAPILIAGSTALKTFAKISELKDPSLKSLYRTKPFFYNNHATIVSYNPAIVSKGRLQLTTNCRYLSSKKDGPVLITPTNLRTWSTVPSPQWHYEQSLQWLAPYIYPDSTSAIWDKSAGVLQILTTVNKRSKKIIKIDAHALYTAEGVLTFLDNLYLGIEVRHGSYTNSN